MGKKMKVPFLFRTSEAWPWPTSCGFIGNPKTLSFRADNNADSGNMLKTLNSAYRVDECSVGSESPAPERMSSASSSSSSESGGGDCVESLIRGVRSSERLFFEPGGARSSKLLEEEEEPASAAAGGGGGESFVFEESVEMEIASRNPFADFRRSMEEMVEAHGGGGYYQDWKFLEELLACYLRINGKGSHGYIVGAFVDLLVQLFMDQSLANEAHDTINVASSSSSMASSSSSFISSTNTYTHCLLSSSSSSSSSTTTTHSFTSPLSFCSSLSSLLEEAEDDETEKSIGNASSSSSSSLSPHLV